MYAQYMEHYVGHNDIICLCSYNTFRILEIISLSKALKIGQLDSYFFFLKQPRA